MQFDVRHISIPFRFQYGHSLKQHRGLQGIVCSVSDQSGNTGYGEAVPREYVTGENCDSILSCVEAIAGATKLDGNANHSLPDLMEARRQFAGQWATEQRTTFPSCVFSAIDLAYCDLFAKQQTTSLHRFLTSPNQKTTTTAKPYCASIGFGKGWKGKLKLKALIALYKQLGFKHFKIKVGTDDDEGRIKYIRNKLGSQASIFADANAAWTREQAATKIEMLAKYDLWAIEEPLQFRPADKLSCGQVDRLSILDDQHYQNYAWLRQRSALPLIADESLICLESQQRILQHEAFDILNIRLSKCGGPLLSMQIIQNAVQAGLRYSVAAMVGESPILAAAGAHFGAAASANHGHAPEYLQGYSHGLLHKVRFATGEPKLKQAAVQLNDSNGLGLSIDLRKLDSLTVQQCQFQI